MSKSAVVYWSETGNTEAMAAAVADGAREKGAEIKCLRLSLSAQIKGRLRGNRQ